MNTATIMRRAWQFYKENRPADGYTDQHAAFGYCLKVAWAEARGQLVSVVSLDAVRRVRRNRAGAIIRKMRGPLVLRAA